MQTSGQRQCFVARKGTESTGRAIERAPPNEAKSEQPIIQD